MRDRDYYYDRQERGGGDGFFSGLLLGGLIGAGVLLYLNSGKGKEKVKELKEKAKMYRDQIEQKLEELKEGKLYPAIENLKGELKERIDDIDLDEIKTRPSRRRRYNE